MAAAVGGATSPAASDSPVLAVTAGLSAAHARPRGSEDVALSVGLTGSDRTGRVSTGDRLRNLGRKVLTPTGLEEPEPEPQRERSPSPPLVMRRSPSPATDINNTTRESAVWVTPAGIVGDLGGDATEEEEDDSDAEMGAPTGLGEFRFGAPFENVRPQAQMEVNDGDYNDVAVEEMAQVEHERIIWEHFLVLRQETQSKLLHGLFGATHPPHYPGGSHEIYGTHRAGTAQTGQRHPVPAASQYRPPAPGEAGFASALAARVITRRAPVIGTNSSRGLSDSTIGVVSPRSPLQARARGTTPSLSPAAGTQPAVSQSVQPLLQQQAAEEGRAELGSYIGRALIAGNCLLDAFPD
jgi:hypothetical protein